MSPNFSVLTPKSTYEKFYLFDEIGYRKTVSKQLLSENLKLAMLATLLRQRQKDKNAVFK